MAKNSIRDYSATNSSNTDIQSIDISEGCSPAGINNAIREVMADLKDVSTGTVALESPSADSLTVTGDLTVDTNTLYVDSTNNRVGIGTASPTSLLHVASTSNPTISLEDTDNGFAASTIIVENGGRDLKVTTPQDTIFVQGASEAARLDASGNLLVGTTSNTIYSSSSEAGSQIGDGYIATARAATVAYLNRLTSDGSIVEFRKSGTTVGSIASISDDLHIYSSTSGHTGLRFASTYVGPTNNTGASTDNTFDMGAAAYRWDDIYATNGTIQTSDANEKQQIASLTDAEITAAKAISALFKTFKWNDAVAEKGDAARTHAGVIAQDVQAAMTAAGLDAGNYAFFISSTWWETQTEVPAVEAVEAVYEDVVIPAVLDDEGNEIEPERVEQHMITEAVEAADAYTRTDTYETAEEAPEGAVERTRLGIRYPELLAFIGAATEQRLASIETRLTALENA